MTLLHISWCASLFSASPQVRLKITVGQQFKDDTLQGRGGEGRGRGGGQRWRGMEIVCEERKKGGREDRKRGRD